MKLSIRITGECRTEIRHEGSGDLIETDCPIELGGGGTRHSSTDLLAAALGSCIATSIERVARNNGLNPSQIGIEVTKELSTAPRRVGRLLVDIDLGEAATEAVLTKIERAAATCPVHRSLHPDVDVSITVRSR